MCTTCGCSDQSGIRVTDVSGAHHHPPAGLAHDEALAPVRSGRARTVVLEQQILAKNDALAQRNRGWLKERGILTVNLMSSPGSGKTTLLERTVHELGTDLPISVIEGDQETLFDAERIRATGCPVVQVNTGSGCHLDAEMIGTALHALDPPADSLVVIENVGNLVCPALFDLGEDSKVVVMSVTEGADKPLKYPQMFRAADLVLLNKIDLLPYVQFDLERFLADVRAVNHHVEVLPLSATRGDGIRDWCDHLRERVTVA